MAYLPNSELVTSTYLRSTLSSRTNFGVGGTLPEDLNTWKEGFVQVTVVGGPSDIYVAHRRPVVQIDCWVPSINSSKPQWGKANTIAEDIISNLYGFPEIGVILNLGSSYKGAHIQTAYPLGEPRKVNNDLAGHARYTFDISLTWVVNESGQTP